MVYKIINMLMHKIINIYLYAQNNPVVVLKNCGPELVWGSLVFQFLEGFIRGPCI